MREPVQNGSSGSQSVIFVFHKNGSDIVAYNIK